MTSDLFTPTTARGCLIHARQYERGHVASRNPDKALRLYEHAIGIADTYRDLASAMRGACRVHDARGQYRQSAAYRQELDRMTKQHREHPKQRQLFLSEANLRKLPYLRRHRYTGGSPGRFNPERRYFGGQVLIAAVVWEHRPYTYGSGYFWEATIFWLSEDDAPFTYQYYRGEDSRPCEGVTPEEVIAAVRGEEACRA